MKSLLSILILGLSLQGIAADKFILYGVTRVADQRGGNLVVFAKSYGYDETGGTGVNKVYPARIFNVVIAQENATDKTNCSERASAAFARGGNLEIFVDENNWWAQNKHLFQKNISIEIPARAIAICASQAQ